MKSIKLLAFLLSTSAFLSACNSGSSNATKASSNTVQHATENMIIKHIESVLGAITESSIEVINPAYYDLFVAQAYPGHSQFAELERCSFNAIGMGACKSEEYTYSNKDFYSVVTSDRGILFAGTSTGGIVSMQNPTSKFDKVIKQSQTLTKNKIDVLLYDGEQNVLIAGSKGDGFVTVVDANTLQSLYKIAVGNMSLNNVFSAIIDDKAVYVFIFSNSDRANISYIFADQIAVTTGGTRYDLETFSFLSGVYKEVYTFGISANKKDLYMVRDGFDYNGYPHNGHLYRYNLGTKQHDPLYLPVGVDSVRFPQRVVLEAAGSIWLTRDKQLFECNEYINQTTGSYCRQEQSVNFANNIEFLKYDKFNSLIFMGSGTGSVGGALKALDLKTRKVNVVMDNANHGIYDIAMLRSRHILSDNLSKSDFYVLISEYMNQAFNAALKQVRLDSRNNVFYETIGNTLTPVDMSVIKNNYLEYNSEIGFNIESGTSGFTSKLPRITQSEDSKYYKFIESEIAYTEDCSELNQTMVTNSGDFNQNGTTTSTTISITDSFSQTYSRTVGKEIGMEKELKFLDFLFIAPSKITARINWSSTWSDSSSHSETITRTIPSQTVLIPPHTSVVVKACIRAQNATSIIDVSMPFSSDSYDIGRLNGSQVLVNLNALASSYDKYCKSNPQDVDCVLSSNVALQKYFNFKDGELSVTARVKDMKVNGSVSSIEIVPYTPKK